MLYHQRRAGDFVPEVDYFMTTRKNILCAAVLALISSPALAQNDVLSATFGALSVATRAMRATAAQVAVPPRHHHHRPIGLPGADYLPENCANLPVVYERNGDLYKNGQVIGRNASSHKENCDGMVAWADSYGSLYRDSSRVADRVQQYEVSWFGDIIAWTDGYGSLYRNGEDFGRVQSHTFVKFTGDLVWTNSYGELYRNHDDLGRAQSYLVAARTGDVAWTNSYGSLYKNSSELGRAQTWKICDRTGDVGWLDSFGRLHKNDVEVGSGVSSFQMREDGKLIWTDSWGNVHYA